SLAAEVPAIQRDLRAGVGMACLNWLDLDPMCRDVLLPRFATQRIKQATLPNLALADQDQLGLVQHDLRSSLCPQVALHGIEAFPVCHSKFRVQGIIVQSEVL